MPQIGQLPGPSRTISGCIGQVQAEALALDVLELTLEVLDLALEAGALTLEVRALALEAWAPSLEVPSLEVRGRSLEVPRRRVSGAGAPMPAGPRASQPSGSAANFVRHPGLQK
jgi:hypothetical protein